MAARKIPSSGDSHKIFRRRKARIIPRRTCYDSIRAIVNTRKGPLRLSTEPILSTLLSFKAVSFLMTNKIPAHPKKGAPFGRTTYWLKGVREAKNPASQVMLRKFFPLTHERVLFTLPVKAYLAH